MTTRRIVIFLAITCSCLFIHAQQHNLVIKSPNAIPAHDTRTKIFLGGSIDMGNAVDWQAQVTEALAQKNVILLNPRRDDWNKNWKPTSNDSNFRQQVEWELAALEAADIIIMHFAPGSQSPVSLLELGLYARTGKLMVVCPEGYWRKGNVDIVAEKYKIKTFDSLNTLTRHIENIVK